MLEEDQFLNSNELTSVSALIAYASHKQGVSERVVQEIVAHHFGVDDLTKLPRTVFEEAVRFLAEIQVAKLMN